MKLLYVDAAQTASPLARRLSRLEYVVERACSAEQALQLVALQKYDLVLIDLTQHNACARFLVANLRSRKCHAPILVIGNERDAARTIDYFDLGADDCMRTPIDFGELHARLRSLVRRASGHVHPVLSCGSLQYDTNSKRFTNLGQYLPFPPREHAVLKALIKRPGATKSKRELADELCCLDHDLSSKALEIYVARLRKKIGTARSTARIVTLRGQGYMLTAVDR